MNILVTGGLGLIGHNVVTRLQDLGHQVSIVDNKTLPAVLLIPARVALDKATGLFRN